MAISFQDLLNNINSESNTVEDNNTVYVYLTSSVSLPYEENMTVEQLFIKHSSVLEIDASRITDYKMIQDDSFVTIPKDTVVQVGQTYSIRRSLDDKGLF